MMLSLRGQVEVHQAEMGTAERHEGRWDKGPGAGRGQVLRDLWVMLCSS